MRVSIFLRHFGYLLVSLLLLFQPQSVMAERQNWDQLFHKQIEQWMENIIRHDGQFQEWRKAKTVVQPLGANQHQWLVSISKSGKQVGYLVVGEVQRNKAGEQPPAFVLLEYGIGEYILFDDTFAPRHVAAEPVYDGFASYWRIAQNDTLRYVDAKTGERYPFTSHPDPSVMSTVDPDQLITAEKRLTTTRQLTREETNPFDQIGWIHFSQVDERANRSISWKNLIQQKEQKQVILNVWLFHQEVMAPFTVGSIHVWNDKAAYVGVWDEGLRFVPFAYADKVGTFLYHE